MKFPGCARNTNPRVCQLLAGACRDPGFVSSYAAWTIDVLRAQQRYHTRLAARQHALLHRVHRITIVLFILTAIGALTHLLVHTLWLSLVTTFFPALAALPYGALAQSRLLIGQHATAERLMVELQDCIDRIVAASQAAHARSPRAHGRCRGVSRGADHGGAPG